MVLVERAAESVSSVYLEMSDLPWFGNRFGQWAKRSRLPQGPVRPMAVVERLELAQHRPIRSRRLPRGPAARGAHR